MDHGRFDTLARLMDGAGSRRAAMRFLAGGALGGLAARLGWAEAAAAKKPTRRRGDQKRRGAAKRGGKGKKRGRKQDKHRDQQSSGVGDVEGCGLTCEANGGRCCPDGSCAAGGKCCPGENACPDGTCLPADVCCPDAERPPCGACDVTACIEGEWRCQSSVPCEGGSPNPWTCQCECPSGSVLLADGATCCPEARACGLNRGLPEFCCDEGNICHVGELCT
jgi:hypothetical protein